MPEDSVDRLIKGLAWANYPNLDIVVEAIVHRVSLLTKYLNQSFAATASEFGVNKGEFDVLKLLLRTDGDLRLSPSQLSDRLHLSSGAMTNRLDRLESQGLLRRLPDPTDRRGILIEITEKGDEVFRSVAERQIEKEKALLSSLSPSEREKISNLLRKLVIGFEATGTFSLKR
jgi:DNA-binding MarR family transcriptional regulator